MPVRTGAENLTPTGIRCPDRQARSESLYRLRYPGPQGSGRQCNSLTSLAGIQIRSVFLHTPLALGHYSLTPSPTLICKQLLYHTLPLLSQKHFLSGGSNDERQPPLCTYTALGAE